MILRLRTDKDSVKPGGGDDPRDKGPGSRPERLYSRLTLRAKSHRLLHTESEGSQNLALVRRRA